MDDERIERAIDSLRESLREQDLTGKRFLDLGSGSGLFSLAAHRLGASVVSIDDDADSVACTRKLRDTYGQAEPAWKVIQGSVLDQGLIESLDEADVVYSWGVLHHTGDMQRAIELAASRTAPGGKFLISIYNDQGGASARWLKLKTFYNRLPRFLRPVLVVVVAGFFEVKFAAVRLSKMQNPSPRKEWKAKKRQRGMSAWHDWVDWVGGLPFEVARPEDILVPMRQHGFVLENLKTVGSGWGCNEFLFKRSRQVQA